MFSLGSIISYISAFFVTRFRITVLLLISIICIGTVTYTTFLKREGFPAVDVPFVLIQTPYFVNNQELINEQITTPIELAVKDLTEVVRVNSSTTENISFITVEFDPETSANDGKKIVQDQLLRNVQLPEGAQPVFQTFNAGSIDGEHDLVFFLSGDYSAQELQQKAETVANEVTKLPEIATAEVIPLLETQTNPLTGETNTIVTNFRRVGFQQEGLLTFEPAIAIGVNKKSESVGTLDLSDAIRQKINHLEQNETLRDFTITYGGDFADSLRQQISSLENNALGGLLSVLIVLLLFLNFRSAVATAIFIPTVLAATFICLFAIGYSLNTIVLFSLILVLGLFVDDAIVVVEAIDYQRKQGAKGLAAIKNAIRIIGVADLSGSVTTILVFAPMLFISGILGDFIRLIPITVILALVVSVIIALLIIPFVTYVLLVNERVERLANQRVFSIFHLPFDLFSQMETAIGNSVAAFVSLYLSNRLLNIVVVIFSVVLVFFGTSYAQRLDFSVFPQPKDTTEIAMNINFPEGTNLEQAISLSQNIEKALIAKTENIRSVSYFSANDQSAYARISLTNLNERQETAAQIIGDLNWEVKEHITQGTSVKFDLLSAGPPPSEYQFAVQVFDNDSKRLQNALTDIKTFLDGKQIADGVTVTEVKLSDIDTITKKDGARYANLQAKISDTTDTNYVLQLQEKVTAHYNEMKLQQLGLDSQALQFDLGQESENLESFNSTIFSLIVALVVMYALLVIQFNSFSLPLLVLIAIPLSFPGLFPGLFYSQNALSFFVMLGVTGLVGIVVNNSIMLIDFATQTRSTGKSPSESIIEAVKIRFRPIITTSTTTIAGLTPLALSDPFWEPLAFSIIFGLLSSSLLVLVVLPAYYLLIESVRTKAANLFVR